MPEELCSHNCFHLSKPSQGAYLCGFLIIRIIQVVFIYSQTGQHSASHRNHIVLFAPPTYSANFSPQ